MIMLMRMMKKMMNRTKTHTTLWMFLIQPVNLNVDPEIVYSIIDFDRDREFEELRTGNVEDQSECLASRSTNTADALQIKGLEKTNELMAPYLASSSSSRSSQNLLSVPGQNRQPSTESMPEYLQRSRSDASYYPHRAHSEESRGHSFES